MTLQRHKQWRTQNAQRAKEKGYLWKTNNPVRWAAIKRRGRLKWLYGLTQADYNALMQRQGGCCAVCHAKTKLVVDHDHRTGKVRGLLCEPCNRGLGHWHDNIVTLRNAIKYLRLAGHLDAGERTFERVLEERIERDRKQLEALRDVDAGEEKR